MVKLAVYDAEGWQNSVPCNCGTQVAIGSFPFAHHVSCPAQTRISMAISMIATAPSNSRSSAPRLEFEHLLLGDLRELLNDSPGRERDRWLLATLDMLLVSRPRTAAMVYLPVIPREPEFRGRTPMGDLPLPFEKLQRLRDRIAHRAPCEPLAQELIVDLRVYFEGSQSRLESILPLG